MNIPVLSTDVSIQTLDLFAFLPLYVLLFFIMKLLAPAPYKYWKKSSTALLSGTYNIGKPLWRPLCTKFI